MRPENVRSRDYNVEGHAPEVFFRLIELYFIALNFQTLSYNCHLLFPKLIAFRCVI